MKEIRVCSTSGILGYGFPEDTLKRCMEFNPHFIACDAGSTDPGPYYLGSGQAFVSKESVMRDLRLIVKNAIHRGIPAIIGSAGGSGSKQSVDGLLEILNEIVIQEQLRFKVAVINSELSRECLIEKLGLQKIHPIGSASPLTVETINRLHRTVGMMGIEPIIKALENGADVIITGRATDASVFAAYPIHKGMNPDHAWHAAKIIECGAATAYPKSHDCIMAYIRDDGFIIQTPNPNKKLPWKNVAAHSMYENVSPFHLQEPGGVLDTTNSSYKQMDERSVFVAGSRFIPDSRYTIKLEGVEKVGYRTICIAGIRDPILLSQMDEYLESIRDKLRIKLEDTYGTGFNQDSFTLVFRKYGFNAVMGEIEPVQVLPHEIGLVIDVVAKDEQKSRTIMAALRTLVLHSHYDGRLTISGNVAFPFSPPDIPLGDVYRFILNHVVELEDPLELFPIHYQTVGKEEAHVTNA